MQQGLENGVQGQGQQTLCTGARSIDPRHENQGLPSLLPGVGKAHASSYRP
jgi:hypothetical protein